MSTRSIAEAFGLPVVNCRPNRSLRQSLPRERNCPRIAQARAHRWAHAHGRRPPHAIRRTSARHRTAQRSPEGYTATVGSDGSAARSGREYSSITARAARSSCAASRYAKLRPAVAAQRCGEADDADRGKPVQHGSYEYSRGTRPLSGTHDAASGTRSGARRPVHGTVGGYI